jgi:type IV pilus assembly protein PilW
MMMALAIGTMITAATYATYSSQQKAYQTQDQVAEKQQNLRAAFYLIIEEIQMAGYDPEDSGTFSVTSAMTGRIQFETDKDEDGILDSNETIDLGLSPTFDANGDGIPDADSDGDGVPDPVDIGIQTGGAGGFQDIAENIQAVEFSYLDSAGTNLAIPPPDLSAIRSVQFTILAIAERSDPKFINSMTYTTPSGQNWGPYNDNFRRRLLTTTIKCRNLGM